MLRHGLRAASASQVTRLLVLVLKPHFRAAVVAALERREDEGELGDQDEYGEQDEQGTDDEINDPEDQEQEEISETCKESRESSVQEGRGREVAVK